MKRGLGVISIFALILAAFCMAAPARAQMGNAGSIEGTVTDPTGAVIPGATVEIHNPVSRYAQSAVTDSAGAFSFKNIPFNPYHLVAKATNFASYTQDVDVRSGVPVTVAITLRLGAATTTVTVEENGGDLVENESTAHTDVDRQLFNRLPLESASSSVSSLITLSTPGVAADANGLVHGLGDHAENSFNVDNQPITDQQSKVFSNQISLDSIQSLEVIEGAPTAEYGDKTSLVIKVTTRSGLGVTTPHGSVYTSYSSFGTENAGFNLAYGGAKWGNFVAISGLQSGRFLDAPEFSVMHDKGNQENFFDRVDFQVSKADTIHINVGYVRSWFQNPNSFDQQFHTGLLNGVTGGPVSLSDQRSRIATYNFAPTWTHLIGTSAIFTLGVFARRDNYHFYPSGNPLADWSPDLQSESIFQGRTLTNVGVRSDVSYVKGIHNLKAGITYQQTFLTENDRLGIVDPTVNAPCLDANLAPVPWFVDPGLNNTANCATATSSNPVVSPTPFTANAAFSPLLACNDLTRPAPSPVNNCPSATSVPFLFHGHTDVKELALYVQDTITAGRWSFNLGLRGDVYNGITSATQAEPRLGIAYNIKPSNTVLRVSYARTLETPFNESLVIASVGCGIPFIATIVPPPGTTCNLGPIHSGFRNEFHAGLEQAFGKYLVIDGEYIWKYTHNGYDFGVLASTPIAFPIEWHSSKIPGYVVRASVPNYHGFSALFVMSGVAARYFLPQVAGIPIIPPVSGVFRIDHDERFNQTTHLQYEPWKRGPWFGFNWRYDSGLVSGAIPCFAMTLTCSASTPVANGGAANIPAGSVALVNAITGFPLTADQEFQAGLTCNGKLAAPSPFGPALATCLPTGPGTVAQVGSIYARVPAPNKENDDHNPQRIAPRHLFDAALGHDNLFHGDRYKWSLRFTVINLTNKMALYNFLSTFSGTHYVTPRSYSAEVGFHF